MGVVEVYKFGNATVTMCDDKVVSYEESIKKLKRAAQIIQRNLTAQHNAKKKELKDEPK